MSLKSKVRTLRKKVQAIGKPRRVVYTCLFGYSERFLDQRLQSDELTDFVCFTDDKDLRSDFWKIVVAPKTLLDPHRRAKGFKHRPHLFFPNHEYSLYIDNTVELISHPSVFFRQAIKRNSLFMMFAHPERNCVYDEAEVVKSLALDDAKVIDEQMDFYRHNGFKSNSGLHATTVMLRKHNDPVIKIAMSEWHDHFLRYSKRDQLSFDVIRSFFDLKVDTFDGSLANNGLFKWPVFIGHGRLPRNFDDDEYLRLNPDVREQEIHPRKHYLEHGMAEGRPYRNVAGSTAPSRTTFRVDPLDQRGRELQLSKSGQLNEPTYDMWESLLGEVEWTDIVDVGANYGEMLVRAKFPPSARVVAIEPNPRIYPLLRENLKNAGVDCDCLQIAVSNRVGMAELSVDLRWSGLSSLEVNKTNPSSEGETTMVPTMTLDDLFAGGDSLENRKFLLKIDVEGHEISVLEGMHRIMAECEDLAALVEVLHLDEDARSKILEKFDVAVFDLKSRTFRMVEPASLARLDQLFRDDSVYKNDVALTLKRKNHS